jgi:hypothetical protein
MFIISQKKKKRFFEVRKIDFSTNFPNFYFSQISTKIFENPPFFLRKFKIPKEFSLRKISEKKITQNFQKLKNKLNFFF